MGRWCGGAIALCPLACVVGAVAAVAPQGCGSRVLMYTGLGQGGFGEVSLCFWSWLVRRLCGLWVWLWLRCSLGGPGWESRVSGFGVWLGFDLCLGSGSVRRLRR